MVVGDGNRCWFSNAMDRRLLVRPPGPGDACDVRDGGVIGSAAADVTGGDIRHIIDVEGRTWGWRFASGRKLLKVCLPLDIICLLLGVLLRYGQVNNNRARV